MLTTLEKRAALAYIARVRREIAEWEEQCEEEARQGYRPSHCIHGTYMWVEWDCACGWCEAEGNTIDIYANALGHIKNLRAECLKRAAAWGAVESAGGVSHDLRDAGMRWVTEPMFSAAARHKGPIYPRVNGKEASHGHI